jgi:rhamnulokinase
MAKASHLMAVDIGAESGRAVLGIFEGDRLTLREVSRFANRPVRVSGTLHWDILRLHAEVLDAARLAGRIDSIGIDTWGVDFALLDHAGRLLGNPVHYRDRRTEGMMQEAFRHVPRAEIYARTGIQFIQINTLYQLLALVLAEDPQLQQAARLLTIPALLAFWLTGAQADEFTSATTTQCYDPRAGQWATDMIGRLGIPVDIFGEVVGPGTDIGPLRPELGLDAARLITPGTHDTASAVAAVPFERGHHAAYISSGTWSLVGVEVQRPVINAQARDANLTNEGGVGGTFRLLKNVMGLWLLQECRRAWASRGADLPYDDLLRLAETAAAFVALIDPDDERLLHQGDIPGTIVSLAYENGHVLPKDPGPIARCIFESLALKYRWTVEQLERVTGSTIQTIHVVGGGASNRLLCQMTADACGRPVIAGPVEATAIGNILVQATTLGLVSSLDQARQLVKRSVALETYEPESTNRWEAAWEAFVGMQSKFERRLA